MVFPPVIEREVGLSPMQWAVIWLHGLGADGEDFVPLLPELALPDSLAVRFIFPNAPVMPVTINGGYLMPAWYDILAMNLERQVDELQLRQSASYVHQLIAREIAQGIPAERIIIAGFSQGGAVAYEAALSFAQPLGGLLVLSSYLAAAETQTFATANLALPILIQHGRQDGVVSELLGQRAYSLLKQKGYSVEYQSFAMEHTLCVQQVEAISTWLQARFCA